MLLLCYFLSLRLYELNIAVRVTITLRLHLLGMQLGLLNHISSMMMHISRRYDDVHAHYSRGRCRSRPIVASLRAKIII